MFKEYYGIITADGLHSISIERGSPIPPDVPAIRFWAILNNDQATEIKAELNWGDRHRAVYLLNLYASSLGRLSQSELQNRKRANKPPAFPCEVIPIRRSYR